MFVRLSAAIAALSLLGSAALAQGSKPTDPQIAHIAYTAGTIDIAAAKQARLAGQRATFGRLDVLGNVAGIARAEHFSPQAYRDRLAALYQRLGVARMIAGGRS